MNKLAVEINKQHSKLDVNHLGKHGLIEQLNYYREHQIHFSQFNSDDTVQLGTCSWGEIIHTLITGKTDANTDLGAVTGFSGWRFKPDLSNLRGKIDASKSALLTPVSMSMLIVDFYGSGPSSYFDDLQYVCYQFADPHQPDVEKYRMVFPMLTAMPLKDYVTLQPTIQEWVGRHSDGKSDPVSYEIGRVSSFPRASAGRRRNRTKALYNPGGHILHWPEFEDMMRNGDDMTLL